MENKLEKIGKNSFMDNFVKTDDILNDMCGLLSPHKKLHIEQSIQRLYREIGSLVIELQVKNCRARIGQNMELKL